MNRLVVFVSLLAVCCGAATHRKKWSQGSGKIVGGSVIEIEEVPWLLAYEWRGFQYCGASILNENWALTAAHCVYDTYVEEATLRSGSSRPDDGGVVHGVKTIILHDKYVDDNQLLDYDVALIEVDTPFQWGADTQPINLTDTEPAEGDELRVAGWGFIEDPAKDEWPSVLYAVNVDLANRTQCAYNYRKFGNLTERMFCAGGAGRDVCHGDEGGPLVHDNKQVGIVSYGFICGIDLYPRTYTNIANKEIQDFINQHTKPLKKSM